MPGKIDRTAAPWQDQMHDDYPRGGGSGRRAVGSSPAGSRLIPRPRGAVLSIAIASCEATEWPSDAALRERVVADAAKRARARGRRFFEVRGAHGELLQWGAS